MPRNTEIKLVAFDMEGCLVDVPTLWEIMHRKLGTWETHGLRYWNEYLEGEYDYHDFARKDVAVWAGTPTGLLDEAVSEVPIMPGAREMFNELQARNIKVAIITNGLRCLAERLQGEFGIDHVFANQLIVRDGRVTGEIKFDVPYHYKGQCLLDLMDKEGLTPGQVAAVGDGPADLKMFEVVSHGILFNPCFDDVPEGVEHVVEEKDLTRVLGEIF